MIRLVIFMFLAFWMSLLHAEVVGQLTGINISGAEFNAKKLPGKHSVDYLWPSSNEVKRFANAGFRVIRVPFLWERMQPELNGELSEAELGRLDKVINTASNENVFIIIDPHNYAAYKGALIGSEAVTSAAFEDFWRRVAERYKARSNVIFGLMNEPNKQSTAEWATQAQAAINAIRSTGAQQLILVPGTHWTGAHSWLNGGEKSNAESLKNLSDPIKNFAFDMHQYFDTDSSGTHAACVSGDIGVKRLEKVTHWLKETGHRAFLGEFGASREPVCLDALESTLQLLQQNQDVWLGWSYWVAGKWFGKYMFNIYDLDETSKTQFSIIKKFLVKDTAK